MTANYFMLTKDGADLYADYPPLTRAVGPIISAVTDQVVKSPRVNLLSNGSFELNLDGWNTTSTFSRSNSVGASAGSWALVLTRPTTGTQVRSFWDTSNNGKGVPVSAGKGYLFQVKSKAAATARGIYILVSWYDASGNFLTVTGDIALMTMNNTNDWTLASFVDVAPAGAAWAQIEPGVNPNGATAPAGEVHYFDDVRVEELQSPTITGVPANLAPLQWLFKSKGHTVQPRDIIAPTGFVQSVFRTVRDPDVVGDDSATALSMQVYNHGWVLAETLVSYLAEQNGYGGRPIPWPADGGYKVVPVTGTPAVNDGAGTYGMQSVTWPGSGVGVGTLRQIVSGDEGTGRKVAAILDLLAATTSAQRTTITSTFTSTKAAVDAARLNLYTVVSAASDATRRQFYARADLAWFLACQATSAPRGPGLENALLWAMQAIVAKEAGLITGAFTSTDYETMTQPIDAVLAMPSGY